MQETVMHVLRDCKLATIRWLKVMLANGVYRFFTMDLDESLSANIKCEIKMVVEGIESQVLFVVMCRLLWKGRNKFVFQKERSNVDTVLRNEESYAVI